MIEEKTSQGTVAKSANTTKTRTSVLDGYMTITIMHTGYYVHSGVIMRTSDGLVPLWTSADIKMTQFGPSAVSVFMNEAGVHHPICLRIYVAILPRHHFQHIFAVKLFCVKLFAKYQSNQCVLMIIFVVTEQLR